MVNQVYNDMMALLAEMDVFAAATKRQEIRGLATRARHLAALELATPHSDHRRLGDRLAPSMIEERRRQSGTAP